MPSRNNSSKCGCLHAICLLAPESNKTLFASCRKFVTGEDGERRTQVHHGHEPNTEEQLSWRERSV